MKPESRLVTVELYSKDVERLAAFYRDVLGVPLEPGDEERTHYETFWGEWGTPSTGFLFFAIQPAKEVSETRGAELGFQVDDLDAAHQRVVESGATVLEPPTARPWGRTSTYLDPDGNRVQLNQA